MVDVKALTDVELEELQAAVNAEVSRRAVLEQAEATLSALNQKVLTAEDIHVGDEWRQPAGAHNAYPEGWEVVRGGKTWVSLRSGNADVPGQASWREKPSGGGPAGWVQPSGAHDAYSFGDRVLHGGKIWLNVHPGTRTNTWEPGVYGWQPV